MAVHFGMDFIGTLEKVVAIEDNIIENKTRIVSTLQYADKILGACLDASTGDTEKKVFGLLKTIADKALTIVS